MAHALPSTRAPAALAPLAGGRAETGGTGDLGPPECMFDGTVAADLAIAVSPSTGRFRPADVAAGTLPAGALLGHVTGGGGRADEVRAPVSAALREVLVRPGQLVARGQPLAWLQRVAVREPAELKLGWGAGT